MKTTTTTTNTSFACIAATPSLNASALAIQESEELLSVLREELTAETIAMLMEYQDVLSKVVRFNKENDGLQYTDIPSMDYSLRHALATARKVTRADSKAAHGQWALRKLQQQARNKASAA